MRDYLVFKPSVKPLYEQDNDDFWFLFKDNKLMLLNERGKYSVVKWRDIKELDINVHSIQCIGGYKNQNCYCGEIIEIIERKNIEFLELIDVSKKMDKYLYMLTIRGKLLLNWLKLNQYCGICGSKTYLKDSYTERALVCSNCGNTTWPRTSPAIIVAVINGDKLLLAHNKQFPNRKYSVIAGFVEYGETFEECVRREVYEEVGIKIKNIKYFGSQPWPFPNSMMIGFTAEYLEGEIEEDGEEIVHADWFSKDEILGKYNKSLSIGSQLIEWFLKNH
ncbi:NAD(+) diphosphatase [Schnuerera sp. xch1]|uniref:NAD(+) diphosphatase n=1 Tax=Schnuerera sp. xch1 TaxID=2874283 RepID=UPI001CC02CB6|nr:NAD(+) diphosphatase [Schnuerera sp. xch1]MBZ2174212.1 NAD(+) diphosphatase [Schnuerera sp. xch1]